MGSFINEKMVDKSGTTHLLVYKRKNGKMYPADLAYHNKETGFKIYYIYDNDFADKSKMRHSVFEMCDEDGNITIMESPYNENDTQAVIRSFIMF